MKDRKVEDPTYGAGLHPEIFTEFWGDAGGQCGWAEWQSAISQSHTILRKQGWPDAGAATGTPPVCPSGGLLDFEPVHCGKLKRQVS